ncbi:MAG: glycosyltransferase family 39 protein [Bryobacteraceae bacterium]
MAVLFFLAGCAFIPYLGLQDDEVLFAGGLYKTLEFEFAARVFHRTVPLMLLTYLGATKTLFYGVLLRIWPPSTWLVRIPALILGVLTIWFLYLLARRLGGARAGLLAAALLATDPLFLLTDLCDWGPTALFHALVTGALLSFVVFHRTRSQKKSQAALAVAFCCLGLGVWDKALFLWVLAALAVGVAVVFPRELFRSLSPRNMAIAIVAFIVGAFPLLIYNVKLGNRTIGLNASFRFDEIGPKAHVLWRSLDGPVLFGWMVNDPDGTKAAQPANAFARISVWLSNASGTPQSDLLGPALVAAVLLLPMLWRTRVRKPILFALAVGFMTWMQMAITRNAGGAAHHTVLLWPLPHLVIALAFSEISRVLSRVSRAGFALVVAAACLVVGANALVVNQYFAQAVQYGGALNFTDAIYPLSDYLNNSPGETIFVNDWGMQNCLRLLLRGRSTIQFSADADKQTMRRRLAAPKQAFVCHTEGNEFYPGSSARLQSIAEESGYRKAGDNVIGDSHGRAIFEVFRFAAR